MPKTTKPHSVRDLARSLGLSHTTVSDALRNNPRVSLKTRERVLLAARECGYHYNPLAGAIMSEIRRSSVGSFRGVAAILDLESPEHRSPGANQYHGMITEGATAAARQLGFKVDRFTLGKGSMSMSRLSRILDSRNIRGVLILPASSSPCLSELDWEKLSGIYTDYIIDDPPLHTVCPDHFRSMIVALLEILERGYTRPGLVLHDAHDRRLLFRWEAAFKSYLGHVQGVEPAEPLVSSDLNRDDFMEWFHQTQPDVVLSHRAEVLRWMKEDGCDVPGSHGFCCLNVISAEVDSAGLDLLPGLLGKRSMETLIAQLHRSELGIPEVPSTVTVSGVWKDGPTLRKRQP